MKNCKHCQYSEVEDNAVNAVFCFRYNDVMNFSDVCDDFCLEYWSGLEDIKECLKYIKIHSGDLPVDVVGKAEKLLEVLK